MPRDFDPVDEIEPDMEELRRQLKASLGQPVGQVWCPRAFEREFQVIALLPPLIAAVRRSTGKMGTLIKHMAPICYYGWQEDKPTLPN